MKVKLWLVLTLCGSAAFAKDLGEHGSTYPIAEDNLMHTMIVRLNYLDKTGALRMIENELKIQVKEQIENPKPVAGLIKTKKARTFYVDPSYTLEEPILDAQGNITLPPGTRINPLDTMDFFRTLYFIDGSDAAQVEWALEDAIDGDALILVSGSVLDIKTSYGVRVYFDQGGQLTEQLNITQVPAKVAGEKEWLKVEEVRL